MAEIADAASGNGSKRYSPVVQATCPSSKCGKLVLVEVDTSVATEGKRFGTRLTLLWPSEIRPSAAPESLEADARTDYDEARTVLSHSPAAAATLARRCLQHVIRSKMQITKKTLFDEIDAAVRSDELAKPTRAALDHVRTLGNWGAHPVLDQSNTLIRVSRDEAEYTIDVLEMLFSDLYDKPSRAADMAARLGQRKDGFAV